MASSVFRLANLPVGAKVALTAFLALVGVGYLVAVRNIYEHHQDADLEEGMSIDDLRRVYHGLEKEVDTTKQLREPSLMEKMVSPGKPMRRRLEGGGPPAVRSLLTWLEGGSIEGDFAREGLSAPGDPSAKQVIAGRCVRCHNSTDGEKNDVPYASSTESEVQYALVMKVATPGIGSVEADRRIMHLAPTSREELVQITHAHMLSIPVFVLLVAGLFLLTGLPPRFKTVLVPIPLLALCVEFASWWLARTVEPFVYAIAGAGGVFGAALGLQIVCVFGSLWFGERTPTK